MVNCLGRVLAVSCQTRPYSDPSKIPLSSTLHRSRDGLFTNRGCRRWRRLSSEGESPASFLPSSIDSDPSAGFCIIEGPETVQDFAKMQLQEIQDNIRSRRNKIFLLMEEVRRLRIQQRIKSAELGMLSEEQENELPNFPSFIPFLPPLSAANLRVYYATCFSLIAGIIILVAF